MTLENFKKRIKVGLVFVLFTMVFYVVSSEDLLQYVVLNNQPGLQNNKVLILHLIADVGLAVSKICIAAMLFRIYEKLKPRGVPFIGFIWIFALFFLVMGCLFLLNMVSFTRLYIWVDGLIRASGGVIGLAAAYTLYKALPYITEIRTPEEYGRLADEIHALREENKSLQRIIDKK